MFVTKTAHSIWILGVGLALMLATCASSQPASVDLDSLKGKVTRYLEGLFPKLQKIEVSDLERRGEQFLTARVTFTTRDRRQQQQVYLTDDGKNLILGQIWDLTISPQRARWKSKLRGAKERMARLDLIDRPFKGQADAPVTVVEFSDYQCPYCSRAYQTLDQRLVEEYAQRIKFVFKHLPLESLHPWAKKASVAAACAYVQQPETFWNLHALLFRDQKQITQDNLREKVEGFAQELGLDLPAMMDCYDTDATKSVVETDLAEAMSLGISSTPTYLINGAVLQGVVSFEEMTSYIDFALEEAAADR